MDATLGSREKEKEVHTAEVTILALLLVQIFRCLPINCLEIVTKHCSPKFHNKRANTCFDDAAFGNV